MKVINAWLLTSLTALVAAVLGFLTSEPDFAWYALQYPMPFLKGNFEHIYLVDFAYLSFLLLSCYWLLIATLSKTLFRTRSFGGIFLALSGACFVGVVLDFLLGILPLSQECTERTMASGLAIETCSYTRVIRIWLAAIGTMSLIASLLASIISKPEDHGDADPEFE